MMVSQTTEEKILAAAEAEFVQKGFDAARTTAIAREAGVTHAMLHYYFRSKENLFEKIIESKISLLGELMLDSLVPSSLPLFDKIKLAITRHLDFISANPGLPHFFIREIYSRPERLAVVTETLQKVAGEGIVALQRGIDEEVERGKCRRVDAAMLMLDIVSLNIFSFVAQPMIEAALPKLFVDKNRFLEERRINNIDTIMRKLQV